MVPDGWVEGRVADLLDGLESGVSVNGEDRELEANDKAVLKVSAVSYGNFDPLAAKAIEGEELSRAKTNPKSGQIIISRSNTEELVGASAFIDRDYPNLFLPDKLWQTMPKPNADMKWLSYVLASEHSRYTLSNLATGTSGSMKNITKGELLSLKIYIPPSSEQKKIAKILSSWDKAITTTEQLLANSQKQKKALMQQLLTGKRRLLNKSGIKFSGEWQDIRLKVVLREEKLRNKSNLIGRVLSVTNHSGFVLPEDQFSKRVASDDVSNYKVVLKGQYGYNPSRLNVGSFARLDDYDEGLLSPMYVVFSINERLLNSDYFLNWMSSGEAKQRIAGSTQGSVRDSVGFDALCSFPFKLPPIDEQQKIAAVLSMADHEITALRKNLDALKLQKKALMQQLLTGKIRVKGSDMENSN